MGETTAAGTRCPRCSAAVRPGAPWCTQCYAPLGAAPAPAAPQQRPAAPADVRSDEPAAIAVTAPPAATPTPTATAIPTGTWPCTACAAPNDLAVATCQGCGTPFLAGARSARPTVVLPGVGDLLELSPVRRTGLALGAVLAFVVVTALLALLLA